MPFANAVERALHFKRHGHEFQAADEIQYEAMADAFMGGPMSISTRECTRQNGTDRLRFNVANDNFGVAVVAAVIVKTFYIVPPHQIIRRNGKVGFFNYECARTSL